MNIPSRRCCFLFFLACAALAFAGCWKDRLAWSPDGSRAVVITKDGLHLCDAEGRITPLLAPGVYRAAWLADSQRLVLARSREIKDYPALRAALGPERTRALAAKAEAIWQQITANPQNGFDGFFAVEEDDVGAIALYLREHHGAALLAMLVEKARIEAQKPKPPVPPPATDRAAIDLNPDYVPKESDPAKDLADLTVEWHSLVAARINGDQLILGATLAEGLAKIHDLRPAPGGSAVAFVARLELSPVRDEGFHIFVALLDGSAPATLVASHTAMNPDWTPDGRALVYLKSATDRAASGDLQLGALVEREVLNASGQIALGEKTRDLAGLIFQGENRVRCLRDGRVLFDAMEFRLPLASSSEGPREEQLFALDRTKADAPLVPLIRTRPPDAGRALLTPFEVSPDETQVLFNAGAAVDILTLATGQLERLSLSIFNDESNGKNPPRAVWRRPGELTYVKIGPTRQELVLRRDGRETVLSRNWSDALLESLIK